MDKLTRRRGGEELDQTQWLVPAVDILENEAELLLIADLPGVQQDALELSLERSELTLEARRCHEQPGQVLGRECSDMGFRRSFALPTSIDGNEISAELAQGVLKVRIPKSAELRPRRITVKAR